MKKQAAFKLLTDIAMTVLLMLLMAFELIGREAHEWLGMGMLAALVIHHILNRKWSANWRKGRYTPARVLQTLLVLLVLFSMLASAVSGIVMSRYVFDFLPLSGGRSWARVVHMLAAYWGFIFLSLHLGFHWNTMMTRAGKVFGTAGRGNPARINILRILAAAAAAYGLYAFWKRGIPDYLFLRSAFVFFDFEEPLFFFYIDYIASMACFVWIGHYLAKGVRNAGKKKRKAAEKTGRTA